ncbi:MAG TPA: M23 family metallopeptidase [Patescibacteria group bacterium]|nr:M23 family metallopeptidase [Patescibacteria group bacterium]
MPDPRRLYRRITESSLPTRVIAHLSVVSLVAVASLTGLSQTPAAGETNSEFLALVQQARGAADQPASFESLTYELGGAPDEQVLLERNTRATVPQDAAPQDAGPLPTPVAVDPNATPLPGPQSTGTTTTGVAPTTRNVAPAPATGALVWPVPAGSISQYYHAGHLALDIAAPYGSQIVAAQGGTVTWAGWRNNGGGYVISINHGNGMTTVYNHLGSIWVSPGQYVGAGQGIGGVGCTGLCTGPHVHFEVIVNGVIDNPLRYY